MSDILVYVVLAGLTAAVVDRTTVDADVADQMAVD